MRDMCHSSAMTTAPMSHTNSADYAANARYVRPWFWYDWANSAFVTTIGTVLYGPYITSIAKAAACPGQDSDLDCATNLSVLGIPIAPGSLAPYTTTVATILSAIVLIFVGAIVDRMERPAAFLGLCAWAVLRHGRQLATRLDPDDLGDSLPGIVAGHLRFHAQSDC